MANVLPDVRNLVNYWDSFYQEGRVWDYGVYREIRDSLVTAGELMYNGGYDLTSGISQILFTGDLVSSYGGVRLDDAIARTVVKAIEDIARHFSE